MYLSENLLRKVMRLGLLILCGLPSVLIAQECTELLSIPMPDGADVPREVPGDPAMLLALITELRGTGLNTPPAGAPRDTLRVVLRVYVESHGAAGCAGVTTESGNPHFDSAIQRAMCVVTHSPATRDGVPTAAWREIPFSIFVAPGLRTRSAEASRQVEWRSCRPSWSQSQS